MSVLDREAPTPDVVLPYADRPDAVVDVFWPHPSRVHQGALVDPHSPQETRPPATPEPVRLVVYLHGGFWRQAYDRSHARPLAAALAAEGAVVALPEFRRVGGGGGWPTTCTDVRDAVSALPGLLSDHLAERGLVVDGTTLTGHSAGGHLALWLVATGTDADATLDRAVAIAPVGDLRDAAATGMGDGAVRDFLGTTETVDDADPGVLLGRRRPAYPVTILHGTADDSVPVANSRGLVARHPWVRLVELDGVDHFAPIDPVSAAYPVVRAALLDPPTV